MTGLDEGTLYSVKVRAVVGRELGEEPVITAQEATFGLGKGSL